MMAHICHSRNISVLRAVVVLYPYDPLKNWYPFDEIEANPSDPMHVVKLMGRIDGLGVVYLVGMHHLSIFYWH